MDKDNLQNKSIEELLEELTNTNLEIDNLKEEIKRKGTVLEDLLKLIEN